MRDILKVIDAIESIDPDLKEHLSFLKNDILYTAPEAMVVRWVELGDVLQGCAENHPKRSQIIQVLRGGSS